LELQNPVIIELYQMPMAQQCKHGFMTHKTGVGKTGKPYEGYVCPETDRNQQCKPVWLQKTDSLQL
jgi:hypothetical protein